MALSNGLNFHLAAVVKRRGKFINISTNSSQKRKAYHRMYSPSASTQPGTAACQHAEMGALVHADPGDTIYVMRWRKDGHLAMAKPCRHCHKRLKNRGVHVIYTDDHGNFRKLKF